jgi:hypothetical protein
MEYNIIVTTCDLCKIDTDLDVILIGAANGDYGFFLGHKDAAIKNGWRDEEFGLICRHCADRQDADLSDAPNVEHGAIDLADAIAFMEPKE